MRLSRVRVCPKSNDKYTYKRQKRQGNTETHRGKGHAMMVAEIGVM